MSVRPVLIAGLFLLLCAFREAGATEESARVYEALFAEFGEPARTYVIREAAVDPRQLSLSSVDTSLLKRFGASGNVPKHRRSDFGAVAVDLFSNKSYNELFAESSSCSSVWKAFHERFPKAKALIELSHVAFNRRTSEALVVMTAHSACLGGSTDLLIFERDGSTWKFKRSVNVGRG